MVAVRGIGINPNELTPREKEIKELRDQGLTPKAIAETLCITRKSVYNHIDNIRDKLRDQNELARAS